MMAGVVDFSPGRLREIREVRGLSQVQVSELLGVTNAAISAYENGKSRPSTAVLNDLATCFRVPIDFFHRPEREPGGGVAFYRSLSSATKKARTRAEHRVGWLTEITSYMDGLVHLPAVNLPSSDVPADPLEVRDEDVERLAQQTRSYWGMGLGPVANMVRLVESNGVVIAHDNLESQALDSLAYQTNRRSFILVGREKGTAVRWRYDTAHELGHLVLHSHLDQRTVSRSTEATEIEAQAHRFAGAFLLPLEPFGADFYSANLDMLLAMKAKWKVSIGAMLSRASKAGMISQESAQRLWINYSRRGWRRSEPLDDQIEPERPSILAEAEAVILREGHSPDEVRQAVALADSDIEILCGLPPGFLRSADAPRLEPRQPENVISFPGPRP